MPRPQREPSADDVAFDATLIAARAPLVVALSGGLDSQVLLHILRYRIGHPALHAAHFNHRMRPDGAADAAFVAGLCRAWEVPLVTVCATRVLRSETEARVARYAFLDHVAAQLDGALVAMAHHADDQAETILLRIARGTGIDGLRGIPRARGRYIRPLLEAPRAALEAYAAWHGIRGLDDATNYDVRRPRNAIRHLVLPHLEAVRPDVRDAVLRVGREAGGAMHALRPLLDAVDDMVMQARAERRIVLAAPVLQAYHPEVLALLLRRLLARAGSAPDRAGTRAAVQFITAGRSGARLDLPGGLQLERSYDDVVVRWAPAPADSPVVIASATAGSATARLGGRVFRVAWRVGEGAGDDDDEASARVDPEDVAFPLVVRGWQPGDRIRLGYGSKKLKKLFGERKVSRPARSRTPVLVEAGGRILWVVGHARAADARARGPALLITVTDG